MDTAAKQQVVERVKQAQNILVTVSTNPSVDQLAACIGLTLLLNKMGKHSTAVFSGAIPSTLEFLQPENTIEQNTDSLRDFIISLDKDKADKLRYKVEDQVVKIFITPYRTSLTEKDLVFSQGDFNVEAVLALGVKDKSQLDAAITAHGRILHDATVISVNAGDGKAPDLGQINWQDPGASSLSEMLVSISEAFGPNLLDNQMATAFLTGIVAETERFSNPKTSPKVMTMSAQLMAAGANQQLIVSKLAVPETPQPEEKKPGPAEAVEAAPEAVAEPPVEDKGTLKVEHDELPKPIDATPTPETTAKPPETDVEQKADPGREINIDAEGNIVQPSGGQSPDENLPTMPGSHAVLTSQSSLPDVPFTANTEPEWNLSGSSASLDPLSPKGGGGTIGHAKDVTPPEMPKSNLDLGQIEGNPISADTPPHVDTARNAVEEAFASAPFNPDLSPVQALNAQPMADLHPTEDNTQPKANEPDSGAAPQQPNESQLVDATPPVNNDAPAPPAPPLVPPPIMPSPGIVIPAAPYIPNKGVDQKIDAETL